MRGSRRLGDIKHSQKDFLLSVRSRFTSSLLEFLLRFCLRGAMRTFGQGANQMSERGFLLDDIMRSQEQAVVAPGSVITVDTMLFAINTQRTCATSPSQQKVSATRFVNDAEKNPHWKYRFSEQ